MPQTILPPSMTISLQGFCRDHEAALRASRNIDRRKAAAFSPPKTLLRRRAFDRRTLKIDNGAVNNVVMSADSLTGC